MTRGVSFGEGNPIRFTDPTGHVITCDADEDCNESIRLSKLSDERYWKRLIKDEYGVIASDGGGKKWTTMNLKVVYFGLGFINRALPGNIHIEGAIFKLGEARGICKEDYCGWTSKTTVTFYTTSTRKLRYQNLYHETGHVVDNMPDHKDQYSTALDRMNQSNPSYLTVDGYISQTSLESNFIPEPNGNGVQSEALQHPSTDPGEQWADMFANYIAGNINMADMGGIQIYNFVNGFFR